MLGSCGSVGDVLALQLRHVALCWIALRSAVFGGAFFSGCSLMAGFGWTVFSGASSTGCSLAATFLGDCYLVDCSSVDGGGFVGPAFGRL